MPTIKQIKTPDNTTYDIHGVDDKAYHTDDTELTSASSLANSDYIPIYDTSDTASKKFKISNLVTRLKTLLGLGNAAYKDIKHTYDSSNEDAISGKGVADALSTLPEPMIFKGSLGTGGTVTTLPTASSSNKGYTYKVITDGTYASQSAKVGDTFISDGTTWVLIPSGDEPSGTVTNVAIQNGNNGITVSGGPITESGTLKVSHADTSSQASSTNSGRTYIQSIGLDGYGHVTSLSTATETVTNTDTNVTQTLVSTNKNYPLLFSTRETSDTQVSRTGTAQRNNSIYVNPSNKMITVDSAIYSRWIDALIKPTFWVKKPSSGTGANAGLALDTKGGRWGMFTYPSSTETLYFQYFTDAKIADPSQSTSNTADASFSINGSTNVMSVNIIDTKLQANDITVASNDQLVVTDSSDSNKLRRTSIKFGTSTTTFLNNKGEWAEPIGTTYSFANGTNQFTVTPSGGSASTIKVTPQLKIDGITSDTTDKEINCYGECSTAAGTAAKTVSITKGTFALVAGSKVIVKFTNANTANNPTLNVNSKGAKNIFHNGARITTGTNKALLAGTVEFVYDGTQFQLVGNYINTEYTAASSAPGKVASSSSTGTSTNYARQDHTHGIDLATGDANGQVKIAGTNVSVKGLGSNAYTSTSYLPLAGGRLTGNLYNKSALGNVDATANDNGISDTVYSGTIEGQDKNNRRITRLETSAYANGDICFGMNIRQWYMDTSGTTPTAKQKATKGFKMTMDKAGTLNALLDGTSNADWFIGKNGLVVGNTSSNYVQLTLDSDVNNSVFLTTPSSNGKLSITDDLASYNYNVGTCNLIRYPSQHTSKSQNGLIFLDNGDGSVTVTGTATANTTYYFAVRGNNIWQIILTPGDYKLIGCPSGGSKSTYSINCNTYINGTTTESSNVRDTGDGATVTYDYIVSMGCYIDIRKNTSFPTNGVVFRPQLIPLSIINLGSYNIGSPYAQTNRQLTITKADYSQIATYENTQNASRAYAKNELMIWRGALYRVTTAISSGSAISTSNVTSTTLSAEIKTIRDALNI